MNEYPKWIEYKELEKIMKELDDNEKKNKKSIEGKNKKNNNIDNKEEEYKDYYDDYWDYIKDNIKNVRTGTPPQTKNLGEYIKRTVDYINDLYKKMETMK